MSNKTKVLYAVELDVGVEAGQQDYWVIHSEDYSLCVYATKKEAKEAARGRDHKAQIVRFVRDKVKP